MCIGLPTEPTPKGGGGAARAFSVGGYGLLRWCDLFTSRQLLVLGTFVKVVRRLPPLLQAEGYSPDWCQAIWAYSALANDRMADFGSSMTSWTLLRETIRGTFGRFALPIVWDFTEVNPFSGSTGDYSGAIRQWIGKVAAHLDVATRSAEAPTVTCESALQISGTFDAIVTDPPYYDAIPYSDLADFFRVWLRRALWGFSNEFNAHFNDTAWPEVGS